MVETHYRQYSMTTVMTESNIKKLNAWILMKMNTIRVGDGDGYTTVLKQLKLVFNQNTIH